MKKLPVILKVICEESHAEVNIDTNCRGRPCFGGVHSKGHVLCRHDELGKKD